AEGTGNSGTDALDEKERGAQTETEGFYGNLPGDGGISERTQESSYSCDAHYIRAENGAVCSYLVCLSGTSKAWNISGRCDFSAGGNLRISGYAAAAGRYGNQ